MNSIAVDLLLGAIAAKLELAEPTQDKGALTPDVGALVRDRGTHKALEAARLRRNVAFLFDVANCAEFVLPKYRRRLKR